MSWDDYEPYEREEPADEGPFAADDPAVQELEPQLLALFDEYPDAVFYESQLAVRFEKNFFHWVTVRALKELREAGKISSSLEGLKPVHNCVFTSMAAIDTGSENPKRSAN